MALFGSKKKTVDSVGDSGESEWQPQPDKAKKWLDHARTSADSARHEYALVCYANAIKLDPEPMAPHMEMHEVAKRFRGKPGSSKEAKDLDDGTAAGKFAAAELLWMRDRENLKLAVRVLETAIDVGQTEFGKWMTGPILNLLGRQKKLSKNQLKQLVQPFQDVSAFEESMRIAEKVREIDPGDSEVDEWIKNLSAELVMNRGGYTNVAEGGSFKDSIRDADKQKELIEDETLAGGASAEERTLARAKAAFEDDPSVPDHINRYAQLLKKKGTPEMIKAAFDTYMQGFESSGEYRFRMAAGDIKIEQRDAKVRVLAAKLEENPDDDGLKAEFEDAREKLLELQTSEYTERVSRYPTDRFRKFDLGRVQYARGEYDDAMAQFQNAKDEPKLHARAAQMLGRCFMAEKWYGEAIAEFREALQVLDLTDKERELEIRYELMEGLMQQADEERSSELAREAKELCSEIARKNITYRDIRQKRREIDELIKAID